MARIRDLGISVIPAEQPVPYYVCGGSSQCFGCACDNTNREDTSVGCSETDWYVEKPPKDKDKDKDKDQNKYAGAFDAHQVAQLKRRLQTRVRPQLEH